MRNVCVFKGNYVAGDQLPQIALKGFILVFHETGD